MHTQSAPDLHSSDPAYGTRFSGAVGELFLERQREVTEQALSGCGDGLCLLDVGGGHGQNVLTVRKYSRRLVVAGSGRDAPEPIRLHAVSGTVEYQQSPLPRLDFPDDSFDVVLCYRLLAHTADWNLLVSELCRVAKRTVIIEYPSLLSCNVLGKLFFWAKLKIEKTTREFRAYSPESVRQCFRRQGFCEKQIQPQFLFPMALHRLVKSKRLSKAVESIALRAGLVRLFGSPIVHTFERQSIPDGTHLESSVDRKP